MIKSFITLLLLLLSSSFCATVIAGGVYQEPDEFIQQAFNGEPPKADVLWLTKDLKKQIAEILDHNYKGLRVRYWLQSSDKNQRTAWILEEIGKEKPITTGIIIQNGKIELVKVLVFRESRGWEVRHDFFTDQFKQAKLKDNVQLDKRINNISGATLSVRAVRKLAQIALLLSQTIPQQTIQQQPLQQKEH